MRRGQLDNAVRILTLKKALSTLIIQYIFDAAFNNPAYGKIRPKRSDGMVAVLWNLTNSSESQSASMLLRRRNKLQFNIMLSMTTPGIHLGPQIIQYSPFLSCHDKFVSFETTSSS